MCHGFCSCEGYHQKKPLTTVIGLLHTDLMREYDSNRGIKHTTRGSRPPMSMHRGAFALVSQLTLRNMGEQIQVYSSAFTWEGPVNDGFAKR
jgi:hypothetical protein